MTSPDLHMRLCNWGLWTNTDLGGPDDSCVAKLWRMWVAENGWDEGWGSVESVPTEVKMSVYERDAEVMDAYIRQMPSKRQRAVVIRHFADGNWFDRLTVDAAMRAVQDVMDAHRMAVREMEGRLRRVA